MVKRLSIYIFLALAAVFANAEELKGRVVKVADGDTITVLVTNVQHKIRLNRIDAARGEGHFFDLLWGGFPGADAPSIGTDKTVYSTELIRNSD